MPIALICPKLTCRAVLRVPDNVRGKRVRCSECGMTFFVPEPPKAPAKSALPPAETKTAK